jgi:hexosaminidase
MRCLVAACTALVLVACGTDRATPPGVELPALIPVPLHVQHGEGAYRLAADARISGAVPTDMHATLEWIIGLINEQAGLSLSLNDGPGAIRLELEDSAAFAEVLAANNAHSVREAYLLEITDDGIRIAAPDEAGLFYGLTTLWQLLTANSNGEVPLVTIADAPEFEWRGVMLDSARHMQSPAFIKRYIDWMALHKLNVFHWHLTDDQGWRLEIRRYPDLTDVGAWRVPAGDAPAADIDEATGEPRKYGGYYSQETVRDIVAHAASRHVTIVPEIDVPGHATAAIAAYPALGVPGHGVDRVSASWGIFENVFNLEEDTFKFLEQVLSEVTELFPGEYIHLGGDEVVTKQWLASERIAERMQELGVDDIQALQNYYVERLQDYLSTLGRKVIGWDEIIESELPPEAAVMSWRGVEGAVAAAAKGHKTVLSLLPGSCADQCAGLTAWTGRNRNDRGHLRIRHHAGQPQGEPEFPAGLAGERLDRAYSYGGSSGIHEFSTHPRDCGTRLVRATKPELGIVRGTTRAARREARRARNTKPWARGSRTACPEHVAPDEP